MNEPSKINTHASERGRRLQAMLTLAALVLGFAGLLWVVFRDQLTPSLSVEAEAVVLLIEQLEPSAVSNDASEMLFQASGWSEPDPWPVSVAVLTSGFVESISVREGESVTNNQVLAQLDQADAKLALREAVAAEAAAKASRKSALDAWERISALQAQDTSESERIQTKSDLDLKSASLDAAQAKREMAELGLERTVIRSPMDGIVLRRYVQPGSKRSPAQDDPNSAVIVSLYDPAKLQVRVDVPIAEAGRLTVNQPVRVTTALLPGQVITGRVTRIVGEADIQRNTLQVKVSLLNPDRRLRPEVLCRAEFWSRTTLSGDADSAGLGRHSLWVPKGAISDSADAEQQVWVVDPITKTAHMKTIKLAPQQREGYRRVLEGLRANELVVTGGAEALQEGRRVSIATAREAK